MTPENDFECLSCGQCCRWPGAVKVTAPEIDQIAAYLGISTEDFIEKHTRLMIDRSGLSLNEKNDGSCEFLNPIGRCGIHDVKPGQCRRFPREWRFPGWEKLCAGGRLAAENARLKKH